MTTLDQTPAAVRIVPGMGVTLHVSDCPSPVFGVITRVYDDAGDEVAEIKLAGRPQRIAVQCTRFLKAVGTR